MHIQVVVGNDAESGIDLVKHFAVLAGDYHLYLEAVITVEGQDEGGHLDGFGSGPINHHDGDRWAGAAVHDMLLNTDRHNGSGEEVEASGAVMYIVVGKPHGGCLGVTSIGR